MKSAITVILAAWLAAGEARAQAPGSLPPSPAWVTISTEQLRADFDTLWAVSDVHGRLEELDQLLVAANLVTREGEDRVVWNRARPRQLLVALGDYIDGGRDSVGVVLRFDQLSAQAAAAGSRIIALAGNHEAAFLADLKTADRHLLSSAHRSRDELGLHKRPTAEELSKSEFGRFLRGLPIVAFIGSWLFAHAGYIDAKDDRASVLGYFTGLASTWSHEGIERYRAVLDPESIVSNHNWWRHRSRRSRMKVRLAELGLDGLVFGHDPDALGFQDVIAMDRDGWFIKVDAGMKDGAAPGMLLRCDVARLVRDSKLAMMTNGRPNCQAMTPDGKLQDLPR
jgi:Calcineurin-like phosphoesterase